MVKDASGQPVAPQPALDEANGSAEDPSGFANSWLNATTNYVFENRLDGENDERQIAASAIASSMPKVCAAVNGAVGADKPLNPGTGQIKTPLVSATVRGKTASKTYSGNVFGITSQGRLLNSGRAIYATDKVVNSPCMMDADVACMLCCSVTCSGPLDGTGHGCKL